MTVFIQGVLVPAVAILFAILICSFLEWLIHGPMMHGRLSKLIGLRKGQLLRPSIIKFIMP